eukprot:1159758-Pelagomonas_calceolata.AAC.6
MNSFVMASCQWTIFQSDAVLKLSALHVETRKATRCQTVRVILTVDTSELSSRLSYVCQSSDC